MTSYRPAPWLRNRHLMTVFAVLPRLARPAGVRRERWELPDGDFIDIDRVAGPTPSSPIVLVLHGLEGSSRAGYVQGVLAEAQRQRLAGIALNFRGCSGEINRLPRYYHSGDTRDLATTVERLIAEEPSRPIGIVGFSLGGNVLCKWFAERGDTLPTQVRAAAAISPPLDLAACAAVLDARGFWPAIYRNKFLISLKRKALAKAKLFPGLVDVSAIRRSSTFAAFDDLFTAPLNGFRDATEYWRLCSAGPMLDAVRRPLHILTAVDDPFVPPPSFAGSPFVSVELTPEGGHVAFIEGWPWRAQRYAERRAVAFVESRLRSA